MASYPHIHLATVAANQQGVKSLADIAIDACIRHQTMLGDVGFVEASHLRRILPHCSRTTLETIEDATLAFSGRDLSWLTWDCWYVIFREAYGPPGDDDYLQLASEPPEDYTPPAGQFAQPADYRSMLLAREAAIAARKAAAVGRLRAGYNKEAQHREALQVKYTAKVPPAKRARRGTALLTPAAAPPSNGRTLAGKPANKVLHTLGLSKGPSKLAPQHTRKTTATGSSACGTYTWTMSTPKTSPAAAAAAQPVSTLGKPQESRQLQQQARQHQQQQRQGLVGQKRSSSGSTGSSGMRSAAAGLLGTPVALGRSAAAAAIGGAGPSRSTGLSMSGPQGCKGSAGQQGARALGGSKGTGLLPGLLDRPVSFGAKR